MNELIEKLTGSPFRLSEEETRTLLSLLRKEINNLDKSIAEKLIERIKLSIYIAKAKRILKQPSYSPEREREIIENITAAAPDKNTKKVLLRIYERVIDESRGLQNLKDDDDILRK